MKTNNEQGRTIALFVGIYFIGKEILNMLLSLLNDGGFGIMGLVTAAILAVLLYSGVKYMNYVVAAIAVIIVLANLGNNISHIGSNLIYLIEGVIDVICAVLICLSGSVREHFTNSLSDIFGGNEK